MIDQISRVPGVGDVELFGSKYAMRIWLDADKLNAYALTPGDVSSALQAQNAQLSVGQLGDTPFTPGAQLNATVTALGRLQTPEQFGNIVLRSNSDGSTLRLQTWRASSSGWRTTASRSSTTASPRPGSASTGERRQCAAHGAGCFTITLKSLEPRCRMVCTS